MELFPFPNVREKQDELMQASEEAISKGETLVAHAPTGLGKTAASLTPALEYAKNTNKTVFFLTPRHSQHQIAVDTVKEMQEKHDVELTVIDLLGKKWLCNIDGVEDMTSGDFKDYCKSLRDDGRCDYFASMYDDEEHKVKKKAKEKLDQLEGSALHSDEFKSAVGGFCPYYMMMELSRRSDLVIADYFHMFHPGVRESIMESADTSLEDSIVIVDEAHNLPGRTRSLFSDTLSVPQLERGETEAEKFGFYDVEGYLERLRNTLVSLAAEKFEQGSHEEKIEKNDLKESIESFREYEELITDLEAVAEEVREDKERSYCGGIAEFLEEWNGSDKGFFRGIRRRRSASGNRYIEVQYSCLDPQVSTKTPLNDSHASIMMSGTLTPQSMYVDLLGLEKEKNNTVAFESPFPEENRELLMVPTVTTKYKERDDSMRQKYAWYLAKSFESVPGNCAAFFPSYSMMKKVKELLKDRTDYEIFMERQDMNKDEKQAMLNEYASKKDEGAALLGVAAGSFGEGVDYPGDIMKAVFVIGLPLQRPDLKTKSLIDFYDHKFGKGWDYGYSYPAMNRAIQAAGRCIRSKDDKGVIVYMDERYEWSNYRKVFPPGYNLKNTRAPWKEIEEFF